MLPILLVSINPITQIPKVKNANYNIFYSGDCGVRFKSSTALQGEKKPLPVVMTSSGFAEFLYGTLYILSLLLCQVPQKVR